MLRRPTTEDHNRAAKSVSDLLKTIELNHKLCSLKLWPTLLKDMGSIEYRKYAKMLEALLK